MEHWGDDRHHPSCLSLGLCPCRCLASRLASFTPRHRASKHANSYTSNDEAAELENSLSPMMTVQCVKIPGLPKTYNAAYACHALHILRAPELGPVSLTSSNFSSFSSSFSSFFSSQCPLPRKVRRKIAKADTCCAGSVALAS